MLAVWLELLILIYRKKKERNIHAGKYRPLYKPVFTFWNILTKETFVSSVFQNLQPRKPVRKC